MNAETSEYTGCWPGFHNPAELDENVDPRIGAPDCYCGHSTMRHHGTERTLSGVGWGPGRDWTACKDCGFCDYYKADLRMRA
jgi:hypothetical protein